MTVRQPPRLHSVKAHTMDTLAIHDKTEAAARACKTIK